MRKFLSISLLLVVLVQCNGGIEPGLQQPGFSGTITFIGNWPDSVKQTIIVLFKNPLLDSSDFSAENLQYVSTQIPYGTKSFNYNTLENSLFGMVEPGVYRYLAVAQSAKETISLNRKDWTIAGIYTDKTGAPAKLIIPENSFLDNINIICDFDNPPPQPPGGS